jgi:hypothetical protein
VCQSLVVVALNQASTLMRARCRCLLRTKQTNEVDKQTTEGRGKRVPYDASTDSGMRIDGGFICHRQSGYEKKGAVPSAPKASVPPGALALHRALSLTPVVGRAHLFWSALRACQLAFPHHYDASTPMLHELGQRSQAQQCVLVVPRSLTFHVAK